MNHLFGMVHATHFWKVRLGISGDASWFWDVLGNCRMDMGC